eukprot:TRINITY_DN786_c0_g1_i1.p1 TRINITY_DN786_c0_g1~~TRINITY_DN786_c0_g1_i1.p1  ORF type:complete len:304 (-),score=106.11 TRINITY_DN786_c0_g1_i1:74-985(-)
MLSLGIPLSGVKKILEEKPESIFQKQSWWNYKASAYSDQGIKDAYAWACKEYLNIDDPSNLTFKDLKLPCAVTTYDLITGEIVWMSTATMPDLKILDAILSTSAAPTYFPVHNFEYMDTPYDLDTFEQGEPYLRTFSCVDGGIWGNDPRIFAFFADRVRNATERNIFHNIVAFGTGAVTTSKVNSTSGWDNSLGWLLGKPNIISVVFDASSSMVENMYEHMWITGMVKSVKMQYNLPQEVRLDDVKSIPYQRSLVYPEGEPNEEQQRVDTLIYNAYRLTMRMGGNLSALLDQQEKNKSKEEQK